MRFYELLQKEKKLFLDFLNPSDSLFSEQDYAYWKDEENNHIASVEKPEALLDVD